MLLEAEKLRLQEELEESSRELQKHMKEVQSLQARLKDAVTLDEHCNIAGKLRRYYILFNHTSFSLKLKLIHSVFCCKGRDCCSKTNIEQFVLVENVAAMAVHLVLSNRLARSSVQFIIRFSQGLPD